MPSISRRYLLKLSGQSLALLALVKSTACQPPSTGSAEKSSDTVDSSAGDEGALEVIGWDEFISELETLAAKQHESNWDQEAHVSAVSELMLQLDPNSQPVLDVLNNYLDDSPNFPELTPIHESIDFEVTIIQFEANEIIDLHNHPDMSGVIHCLSGDITIDGYNLLEETAENGNLLIEKIASIRMSPGDMTSLTAARGNIHALVAHEYTELLDVFTPPYAGDRIMRYRWYGRSENPIQGSDNIFEAWEA